MVVLVAAAMCISSTITDSEAIRAGLIQQYRDGHTLWVKPGCE